MIAVDAEQTQASQAPASSASEITMIRFGNLRRTKLNVRTVNPSKAADKEFVEDIALSGYVQNLVVYPLDDGHGVCAGGRRYGAGEVLVARGTWSNDTLVPCKIVTEDEALDMSYAENTQRKDMHLYDRFMAFRKMADAGASTASIAARHQVSEATVYKALRLSAVHPTILLAFKRDKISYEVVMAYAASTDRKRQIEVYKNLDWQNPGRIRGALMEDGFTSDHHYAIYVGMTSYEAADGRVEQDIFQEKTHLLDGDIVKTLAQEKLDKLAARQKGWKWIRVTDSESERYGFARLQRHERDVPDEITAELSDLGETLERLETDADGMEGGDVSDEAMRSYVDARDTATERRRELLRLIREKHTDFLESEKAYAGCLVFVDHRGRGTVERGLLTSSDARALAKGSEPEGGATTAGEKPAFSAKQTKALGLVRRSAIKLALANDPATAHHALQFSLCDKMVKHHGGGVLSLSGYATDDRNIEPDPMNTASSALWALQEELDLSWAKAVTGRNRFDGFMALDSDQRDRQMAVATALFLEAGTDVPGDDAIDGIVEQLNMRVRKYWTPTEANYFRPAKRNALLKLGHVWLGDTFIEQYGKAKKSELSAYFHSVFNSPPNELTDAERQLREEWIPEQVSHAG